MGPLGHSSQQTAFVATFSHNKEFACRPTMWSIIFSTLITRNIPERSPGNKGSLRIEYNIVLKEVDIKDTR